MMDKINTTVEYLKQEDPTTVVYPYPNPHSKGHGKTIKPYPVSGFLQTTRSYINPYEKAGNNARKLGGRGRGKFVQKVQIKQWSRLNDVNNYTNKSVWIRGGGKNLSQILRRSQ